MTVPPGDLCPFPSLSLPQNDHLTLSSGTLATQQRSLWRFSQRFQPDVVTYTCLIQLYADTRRPEKALQVWHMMNDSGMVVPVPPVLRVA